MSEQDLHKAVGNYYSDKVRQFGATPKGVDWNSAESQELRYQQLLKIISSGDQPFSLLDYGCGYGGMLTFMDRMNLQVEYTGFDISEAMLAEARKQFGGKGTWISKLAEGEVYDYVVASGIFNVIPDGLRDRWKKYMFDTIDELGDKAAKGFSFNVLTSYSDPEHMKDYLFYAQPGEVFDYCMKKWPRRVSLLHDYGLYEFTVLVHTI